VRSPLPLPTRRLQLLAGTLALALMHCADAAAAHAHEAELQTVATYLAGEFSSARQAAGDPDFHAVSLRMTPIWPERRGEHWLYVEQALATHPDQPYRQRVYRLVWRDGVRSIVYTLPAEAARAVAGTDAVTTVMQRWQPDDLSERRGCDILLRKDAQGGYAGSTHGHGCPSELHGAAYATSDVTLAADGLASWDRGFDAQGHQVWGAEKGPYRFERTKPSE
jgi:hypothetical protein